MIGSLPERKRRADDWFPMIMRTPPAVTVLVVEDDFLVRTCAADALSACGFNVLEAANAPDALLLLEATRVDAVFTDINMPGEFDGLGLAHRVHQRWPDVVVVVTSGRGCPDDIAASPFVPKPYMADSLPRLLQEAISGHHGAAGAASTVPCLAS